jgi:cytochrome P450
MSWLFLAMILYPDVQKRAQEELDAVVGRSRMPNFQDINNLPYIQCIVKEILRWSPVSPLGESMTARKEILLRMWNQGFHTCRQR